MKTIIKLYVAFFFVASATSALSMEASVDINLGLEHTDNGEKTETNEISDTKQQAGLDFGLKHEGQKIQAELGYNILRSRYDNNTQDDRTDINGNLNVTLEPIKESLFIRLDSTTRSIVRDKAAVDVADNRENRTISTISPEWALHLSRADQLNLSISYTDIQYQESNNDSDRSGASVKWQHQRSKIDALFAEVNYSDIGFEFEEFDYEYYQTSIGYTASLSKLQYTISIGYNETKRDGSDSASGGFFNAEFNYSNVASNWSLEIGKEITDSSRGNNNSGIEEFSTFQNSNNDIDIYELSMIRGSWENTGICAACTVSAYLSYEEEDYETITNDSEDFSANVRFAYELTRSTQVSMDSTYSEVSFVGEGITRDDYERLMARISVSHKLSSDFSIRAFVRFDDRDSDRLDQSYDELVGGLTLSYALY